MQFQHCRGLAKFLFASSQKYDSLLEVTRIDFFHEAIQICCRNFMSVSDFFYLIFKFRSGCVTEYNALGFAYTKYRNAHPRFDTSTLQPVPETHLGFTKSQGLYVPASIKTLSTYPEKHHFCCIKNATIAEMLPN